MAPESRVLELGSKTGDLIGRLNVFYGVGVEVSKEMVEEAKGQFPHIHFIHHNIETFETNQNFDYILLPGILGSIENIQLFFKNLLKYSTHETRVIIYYYNELWGPLLRLAERVGLKMPEVIFNWLSIDDIDNFLHLTGYEVIRRDYLMLLPFYIPFLTPLFNKLIAKFPVIRRLTLIHTIIARPQKPPENFEQLTTSVIITCRDEEENIEGLVKGIPTMGKHTEIIFVEGHSKDNTAGKIQEMIKKYPEKDIKLYQQKGIGQGDAFRLGCEKAQGDFLCWLEADLTIPPEEIKMFWDAYASGVGEYINGTRFIYQMEKKAMPFLNFVGNRFFGNIFTPLLGQRFTDTLCGFKAISRKNYQKIRWQINFFGDFDPFGDFELIFGAVKNCLKVAEIPVHYRPRQYGEPKAYGKSFFSFLKHAWLLLKMSWTAFIKLTLF